MSGIVSKLESGLGYGLITSLGRTLRMEVRHMAPVKQRVLEEGEGVIFCFWHNRLFYLSYFLSSRFLWNGGPLATIISRSRDGDHIAPVVERFGGVVTRGSSSRAGDQALRRLVKLARRDVSPVVTPDGPRGPKYEVQQGAPYLAALTGLPLVPVSYGVARCIVFNSWDGFMVPYPYTSGVVLFGDPIYPASSDESRTDRLKEKLQNEMDRLQKQLEEMGYDQS